MKRYLLSLLTGFYVLSALSAPDDCSNCHAAVVDAWHNSDHAKSMDIANINSVLGNFDGQEVDHFGQRATFSKENDKFFMKLATSEESGSYEVTHVFGHYPLQQYLTPTGQGRFQVLPFAWDTRPAVEGGQKWFTMYPDELISQEDRLHWRQPLQNWNGMCADCHSTELKRQYSVDLNQFNTNWSEINVSCNACHSISAGHGSEKRQATENTANTTILRFSEDKLKWTREINQYVARLVNEEGKPASPSEIKTRSDSMQACFACHSLRSPVSDGFKPDVPFLDQFLPNLLTAPVYHADGQVKEEAYVYGSFLQSKMYRAGVTCLDCHNPHTFKVKNEGNGLCLQCHSPSSYQRIEHTGHSLESEAGQCVSCHMPEKTFMQVDARREHNFKIPRPDLSSEYGLPNPCLSCHQDKNNEWATNAITQWSGKAPSISVTERNLLEILSGNVSNPDTYIQVIESSQLSEIERASALLHGGGVLNRIDSAYLKKWSVSSAPLIRLALAQNLNVIEPGKRHPLIGTLQNDKFRSIRIASVQQVTDANENERLFEALLSVNEMNSWRGEANVNRANIYAAKEKYTESIKALEHSLKVDPYFDAAYVNLAETYRYLGNTEEEKRVLREGRVRNPHSAAIHYASALELVRERNYEAALKYFRHAWRAAPSNTRFAYAYFLALEHNNQPGEAFRLLQEQLKSHTSTELILLGIRLANKLDLSLEVKNLQKTLMRLQNKKN